jgi:S1-C subfamily serine protease
VAQADGLKTARRGATLIAKVDGRLYPVAKVITDAYSGAAFFKIEARDLPVVAMAKTAADFLPGDSLFSLDAIGGIRRLEIANTTAPVGEHAADLVRSSESLTRLIMTDAHPALPVGAMVLSERSEVIGLVAGHGTLGTLIVPVDAWSDIIDSVLKGNGPQRPYLGVRYLDLAEGGAVDGEGRAERGAKLTATADGKTLAVTKGSPADKAGLRADDIVLAVNGEAVSARKTLSDIVAAYLPGMKVTVNYRRAGLDRTAEVTLTTIDKKP